MMQQLRKVQVTKVQEVTVRVFLCDFCGEEYAEDELLSTLTLPAPKLEDKSGMVQHYILSDTMYPHDVELCENCALQAYGAIAERVARLAITDDGRSVHWVKEDASPTLEELKRWLTIDEAVKKTGVPRKTIISWKCNGLIRSVHAGRQILYDPFTLDEQQKLVASENEQGD